MSYLDKGTAAKSKIEFVKRLESEKRMDEKDDMTRAKVQEHNDVLRWPTSLQGDCVSTIHGGLRPV